MLRRGFASAIGFLLLLALAGAVTAQQDMERPAQWAQPFARAGLPNLHQVTPMLYRSAQPDVAGVAGIDGLGIRTVLSLRESNTDAPLARRSRVDFLRHPLWTWHVEDDDVLAVLRILTDPKRQPVLLHCKHGADRTGLMIASYRVVVQDWSKQAALAEMKQGGYGFHPVWRNIERRLLALDTEKLREALGLPVASQATP